MAIHLTVVFQSLRGVSKNLKVVVRGKGPPFPLKDEKYRKLANFWFENSYKAIANDMKHSGEWKCSEGCGKLASMVLTQTSVISRVWYTYFLGKPATETRAQVIGWFHVDPPFVLIYVRRMGRTNKQPHLTITVPSRSSSFAM